jgi:hypothetical protein
VTGTSVRPETLKFHVDNNGVYMALLKQPSPFSSFLFSSLLFSPLLSCLSILVYMSYGMRKGSLVTGTSVRPETLKFHVDNNGVYMALLKQPSPLLSSSFLFSPLIFSSPLSCLFILVYMSYGMRKGSLVTGTSVRPETLKFHVDNNGVYMALLKQPSPLLFSPLLSSYLLLSNAFLSLCICHMD